MEALGLPVRGGRLPSGNWHRISVLASWSPTPGAAPGPVSALPVALHSAMPALLPHTLALGLVILGLLTIINLRGVRESGLAFTVPTYVFLGLTAVALGWGIARTRAAHGHPVPAAPIAPPRVTAGAVSAWRRGLDGDRGIERLDASTSRRVHARASASD